MLLPLAFGPRPMPAIRFDTVTLWVIVLEDDALSPIPATLFEDDVVWAIVLESDNGPNETPLLLPVMVQFSIKLWLDEETRAMPAKVLSEKASRSITVPDEERTSSPRPFCVPLA